MTPFTSCSISGLVHGTLIRSVIKSTASFEHASPHVHPGDDFLPGKCSGFLSTERILKF